MDITTGNYTADDFKQAAGALLPPGEYWQYEKSGDLDKLLSALGQEFKTTHDETTSSILYEKDKEPTGWKLADYQSLLAEYSVNGVVFDNQATPNLIYVECDSAKGVSDAMGRFEDHRLPHTQFKWTVILSCNVVTNIALTQLSSSSVTIQPWYASELTADMQMSIGSTAISLNEITIFPGV